jgi:hypothetical protein
MSDKPTITERVVVLETKMDNFEELTKEVRALHDELTKYKGMLGLASFIITCLLAAASLAKEWFMSHWK